MKYRIDPRTGKELSVLGFGCMRFPIKMGTIDMKRTEKLVKTAIEQGVNYFDTAYIYPGSEAALGQILTKELRDKVYIADKLPLFLCRSASDLDKLFNKQLERLKTDRIDYYLMHMLAESKQWETLCGYGIEKWIEDQKQKGRIGQIGFSFHGIRDEFQKIIDMYDWDFCQIQYNYMDENNQAGKTGLMKAAAKNIAIIIMEPLLGGKLATGLPPAAVKIFKKADSELTPAAWALKWLWHHPEPTVLLSGMSDESGLEENLKTAETAEPGNLNDSEMELFTEVIKIIKSSYKIPCTGCGYCMPCPFGVNIPMCFAAYNASFAISKGTGMQQYMTNTGSLSPQRHSASVCRKCGKCESHCPQSIPIRQELANVEKRMEPFWYKPILSIIRAVVGIKSK